MSRRIEVGTGPRGLAQTPPGQVGRGETPPIRPPEVGTVQIEVPDTAPPATPGDDGASGPGDRSAHRAGGSQALPPGTSAQSAGGPERARQPELPPPADAYGKTASQASAERLKQGERLPVRTVDSLTPHLQRFQGKDASQLAHRFGSDLALMRPQVMPQEISPKEQAQRLWQFFGAYAQAAAQGPASKEGLEAFRQILQEAGFLRFKDAKSEKNGVQVALWSLEAPTPGEAQKRVNTVELVPQYLQEHPPEAAGLPRPAEQQALPGEPRLHEGHLPLARQEREAHPQPPSPDGKSVAGEAEHQAEHLLLRAPGQEGMRVNMLAAQAAAGGLARAAAEGEAQATALDPREAPRQGVLGNNLLFNVLHRFRKEGAESAVEKEKASQLAFGAMLLLVGMTLAAIALVAL